MDHKHGLNMCTKLLVLLTVLSVAVLLPEFVKASGFPEPASSRFDGQTIDSIVIDNRNIFDTTRSAYRSFIFKLANRLHVRTKRWAIRYELLLKKGEPYSEELAEESARNMRGRLALYDAWIAPEQLPDGRLLVRVVTIDQWSLTGGAEYLREGHETTYNFGLEERNLLGTGQYVSLNYYDRSIEGNYFDANYLNRRLLGNPIRISFDYSSNPLDKFRALHVGHPYYDLSQQFAYDFGLVSASGRRDIYRDNRRIALSNRHGNFTSARASYRFGDFHRKLEFDLDYLYRFEKNSDKTIMSVDPYDSLLANASFPGDSAYHQFELTSNLSAFKYVRYRYIDGIGYTEDFSAGHFLTGYYGRAFRTDFRGAVFDIAGLSYSLNLAGTRDVLLFDYSHVYWFRAGRTLRHLIRTEAKYYNRVHRLVTLASRIVYDSDVNDQSGQTLILGGTTGIRGFPKYYRSGDRRLVLNLEARFFSRLEILSLVPGGVVFADMGNIWAPGDPFGLSGLRKSVGVGLRFGFVNSSRNIVRIDLSYTDERTWDLTIGTRQYFEAHL
ncbi:MAG TPA: hypothetical protein VJ983_04305 [candidate division Zixibacteria bacterium]|nr:hypothetical protein [candidate division Zixibacteria bacterium]